MKRCFARIQWLIICFLVFAGCSKKSEQTPISERRPDGIVRLEVFHIPFSMVASSAFSGDAVQWNASFKITLFSPFADASIDSFLAAVKTARKPCHRVGEIRWRILVFDKDGKVTKTIDVSGSEQCAVIDGAALDCGTALFDWCARLTTGMNTNGFPRLDTEPNQSSQPSPRRG